VIERWVAVDDRVLAATLQKEGGTHLRLSVERLPGGGWDWMVWNSPKEVRYGAAASLDAAMAAAEAAVAAIAESSLPGL